MKILVGYDGTKQFPETLKVARRHAAAFNAQVTIFTASGHSPELHMAELDALQNRLSDIQESFTKEGIVCETHIAVRSLSPGEDMVDFARKHQFDEIIIGVKHRSKIGKLIMGSTAQYVILEASCPVVTVK
ncbi:MAG: universal stress protein [Desulfobacterales bacterium]